MKTTAECVELRKFYTRKGRVFYPVFEYGAKGKTIKLEHYTGNRKRFFKVGDQVELYYNPAKPKQYVLKNDKATNLGIVLYLLAGGFFTIAAIIIDIREIFAL